MPLNRLLLFFFFSPLIAMVYAGSPITLTHDDGSIQDLSFGVCTPTARQDPKLSSIQFNDMSSCSLFDDAACQNSPVTTLEPIIFNPATVIRKGDSSELVSNYFTCSPGQ